MKWNFKQLKGIGLQFRIHDGHVRVGPQELLEPQIFSWLKTHRDQIKTFLITGSEPKTSHVYKYRVIDKQNDLVLISPHDIDNVRKSLKSLFGERFLNVREA